jgi:vancomycin resistance protein YoaR
MAGSMRSTTPSRVRREELVRPEVRRRDFPARVAQRYLQDKERPRWHLIAYITMILALIAIMAVAYTAYAFSRYRGEILPGVAVAGLPLGGLTQSEATNLIYAKQTSFGTVPVQLVYAGRIWDPRPNDIGLAYDVPSTVKDAESVGRNGSFFAQLLDRLPVHRSHSVALRYKIDSSNLARYIAVNLAPSLARRASNANLSIKNNYVQLIPSVTGRHVDVAATVREVAAVLGQLSRQTEVVNVALSRPIIPDAYALRIRNAVENFLSHPPVIRIGKGRVPTSRSEFAPALSFNQQIGKHQARIVLNVNPTVIVALVAGFAQRFDTQPHNAQLHIYAGVVTVVTPLRTGRSLMQAAAVGKLLHIIRILKPSAHPRFKFTITHPPINQLNPASYGISQTLGTGVTGFSGAPAARGTEIDLISKQINNYLISPHQEISFNTIVGTNWPSRDYVDKERLVNGTLVPGASGAIQQVATTFLRALYAAGLSVEERHSHPFHLGWYDNPIGLDAVVSPDGSEDLRFRNNTGKYLLVQTLYQPLRQELKVFVYGPKLGWKIQIDNGTILKSTPHPPDLVEQDSTLGPNQTHQTDFAHDGLIVVIHRTITYPNGDVKVDQLVSHYQPWRSIIYTGAVVPVPPKKKGTPTPSNGTPGPSPTATFNH